MFSDSGSEYRNQILQEMNKKLQIKQRFVAVYHPSSNGLCERKNSSILQALRCFLHLDEWDKLIPTVQLAVNAAYCSSLGDSPFYVYKHTDPQLPATRFAKPKFSYSEQDTFEKDRQHREHFVMETVKEKLLEASDRSARRRQKVCKQRSLNIDDRVFIRRIQKKGESKLAPKWKGPYRIVAQETPNVYKLKELSTGKITEQHIENIKEKIIMARESEIPISECPRARLPFPSEEPTMDHKLKRIPEGHAADDWIDDSFWLTPAHFQESLPEQVLRQEDNTVNQPETTTKPARTHQYNLRRQRQPSERNAP